MDRLKELEKKEKDGSITADEQTELKSLREAKDEVEIGDEVIDAISAKVAPMVTESLKGVVGDSIKETMKSATEKTIKKNISDGDDGDVDQDGDEESKELRFMKGAVALVNGSVKGITEYNRKSMELRRKAGYGNEGTDADGGYLVPDPDFDAEIERLEEEYGVAFQYADVRRINGNSIKLNKKSSGFDFVETTEHTAITGGKLTIGQVTADLRKFARIAPATEELDEDSAVDYWQEVTNEFALKRAKKADELTFTDSTSGILEIASTKAQTVGSAYTDIDWDDLMNAEVRVPSPSQKNGRWFMHRTIWNYLAQKKDSESRYLFQPNPNAPSTPWGTPVVMTEVLPTTATVQGNSGIAVFGDLKHYKLYVKNGIRLTLLTEATVTDADGTDFNLATQDGKALKGVIRMLGVAKFPEAFCVLGIGTVS